MQAIGCKLQACRVNTWRIVEKADMRRTLGIPQPDRSTKRADGHDPAIPLEAGVQDPAGVVQDRSACCGTMNLAEYFNVQHLLDTELKALSNWCARHGQHNGKAEGKTNGANGSASSGV